MSFINTKSKEVYCKIIYVGPEGSGKTTNIQWIYQKTRTSNFNKDSELLTLPLDSALFDFLPVSIGDIRGFLVRLHLYTMMGKNLFNSTTKIILKGLDGIVLVADSHPGKMDKNIEYLNALQIQLKKEGYDLSKIPLVIQYNKRDLENAEPLFRMKNQLNRYNSPDIETVAKMGEGVMPTLSLISKIVISHLQNAGS